MVIFFSPNYNILLISVFLFIFMLSKLGLISTRSKKNLSNNLPPGPKKFPLIGNLLLFVLNRSRLPHHFLRDLAMKYGPVMHLQLGEIPTIVVSSPESAKEVMGTQDLNFATRPYLLATEIIFYGRTDILFAPYGRYWRQVRKIATLELLSAKRVQSFRQTREEESLNLCRWIASNANGSPINLSDKLICTGYDIISRTLYGGKSKEQETFVYLLKEAVGILGRFQIDDLYPSLKFLQHITGLKARLEILHKEADRLLEHIIQQRRLSYGMNGEKHDQEDLLDVLLNLQGDSDLDLPLTTDNIKAVMLVLFFAASDTSSTVIDWAMSEMLKNPCILNYAQEEVRRVFDGKSGCIDESHFDELKYLKLVIKETLRMHPPAPLLLPRETRESCKILGYKIPIKTQVIVNAWAINRDPQYWEDPEKFVPERFLDSKVDYRGNDFEYIPFGAGRRSCPGMSYGIANVEIQLALLLYHFDWGLPAGIKPEEVDMTEAFGVTTRRKNELHLIPIVARHLPSQ